MSLLSSNIFTQHTNPDINSNTTAADVTAAISDANKKAVLQMIDNLTAGDTVLGKVLSQSGRNLSILTQEGVTINAKNSASITFEKGSSILFEVVKRSGRDLSIRPLYQNTSIQNTAEAALRQAGIPVTGRSLEMTGRNMEYGNPIDRQALIESYKDVALFPDAPVKCIVDLQKMGIEVTPNSITQYQAYVNMENSVGEAFSRISDCFLDSFSDSVSNIDIPLEGSISLPPELGDICDDFLGSNPSKLFVTIDDIEAVLNDAESAGVNLLDVTNELAELETSPAKLFKMILNDISNPTNFTMPEQLEEEVLPLDNSAKIMESLADFTNRDSVRNLFKKVLASQWSVSSDNLSEKSEISNLYERLFSQSNRLLDMLNENPDRNQTARAEIQNLVNNLEFMNDLNNYVPYLQIPFHNDENMRNSELYVFTNKKNLASDSGEVSAFIHLDMDHLGPTDVYVKMHDMHVSTNFTVKDEDTLIFLEHHLDFLDARLNKKGYSFESNVATKSDEKSPMEKMLDNNEHHLVLMETSFDARV